MKAWGLKSEPNDVSMAGLYLKNQMMAGEGGEFHTDSKGVQLVTVCYITVSGVDTIWQTYRVSGSPCDSQTPSVWHNNKQHNTTKKGKKLDSMLRRAIQALYCKELKVHY